VGNPIPVCVGRRLTTHHWHVTSSSRHAGATQTALATHPTACRVQSGTSGSPVAVQADALLLDVSCPTTLGALSGQLTFRLAWCREHSAVTATNLLQPLNLACGTPFQSSCAIWTLPTEGSDDSWRVTFFGKHEHGALWPLICGALEKQLLT